MKNILAVTIGISAIVMLNQMTMEANEMDGTCKCSHLWQHAYAKYINELGYYSGLYLGDINGDDIPEAVIDINTLGSTIILYDTENGMAVLELETVSAWGSVTYISDTKQLLYSPFQGHTTGTWGYEEYYVYDWNGTDYEEWF